jgi:hypothetical protein
MLNINVSVFCVLVAVIIYPVFFSQELYQGNRDIWEFGWAYGVAWGSAIFLFGGIVLLLLDKESEQIYKKDRITIDRRVTRPAIHASASILTTKR